MADDTGAGGADDQAPGGADDKENKDKKDKDTVAYETHKKLLDEKKALQKKFDDIERVAKEKSDAELKAKEEYKTLLEQREQELADTKGKLSQREKESQDYRKMGAFLKVIPGEVPQQYWNLIDLDKISASEDGAIDEASVKRYVKDFEKNFPEVIKRAGRSNMPNNAAGGGSVSLTHSEWVKLPYEEKRKRQKDVVLED